MKKKILLSLFLCLLYGYVGYFSFGFDDEFANMRWIEKLGIGIVHFTQSFDVHPPGSYFIDWMLFAFLGKWELVRLFISLITAFSLIYAILSINKRYGETAGLISFFLLGLNPAILFWCTSLRWYAFFVPVLIWLSIVPRKNGWLYWAKCFGGLIILGYLGYAVFIVAIPTLLIYWSESEEKFRDKIKNIFRFGFLFLVLYSYQLFVFFSVHLKFKDGQVSSLLNNLVGFFTAQISNQGLFPLSFPGILASVATIGIVLIILYSDINRNVRNNYFISYSLTSIFTIITGIAGKFRNLVILSPWQALWISTAKIQVPQKKFFLIFLFFLVLGNLWGDYNIISHQNTTKSDWNIPLKEIMNDLNKDRLKCKNDIIILCSNEMLTWNLERSGYHVMSIYAQHQLNRQELLKKHNCVVILKTWAGKISSDDYKKLYSETELLGFSKKIKVNFGRDNYFKIKHKLDSRYPEFMVEATKYYEVRNLNKLTEWSPRNN